MKELKPKFSLLALRLTCIGLATVGNLHAGSDERRIITGALFQIPYEDVPRLANYDYNHWGDNPGLYSYYRGGHGGLDVQTKSVAASATADETFFAVSRGEVITEGGGTVNTIALYDSQQNITTFYLHSRKVFDLPANVEVGDPLGIQGDSGAAGAEHVHIEVRSGRVSYAGGGALYSLDPEPYLIAYIEQGGAAARIFRAKTEHWARQEVRNAIHLGIMKNGEPGLLEDDRAWLKIDKTATRGELVSILRSAALAYDTNYFSRLPDVNSPPFFSTDTDLASSSHKQNVELFARKGLISTTNVLFNVNSTATQGEAVLMAWKLFQLGNVSTLSAVDAYKGYRAKLRNVKFKVPKQADYLIPNALELSIPPIDRIFTGTLVRGGNPRLLKDATGIASLRFDAGGTDDYKEGYSLPASRGLLAKIAINIIHFRVTYPTTWQSVMNAAQ